MTAKILVITPPDDTHLSGIRILHVNLSDEQSKIVSQGLLESNVSVNMINYVWNSTQDLDWLLNVKLKSNIIIFNADANDEHNSLMLNGFIAADQKSYYFGILRDLHRINDRVLLNSNEVITLLEDEAKKYE